MIPATAVTAWFVTLAAAPAAAPPATTAVIAVAEPPGPDGDLAALASQLRDALAGRLPGLLPAAETQARMGLDQAGPSLADCDRELAVARARFQAGDYAEGARATRKAAEMLERAYDAPGAFARWSRAMLNLARAEETQGRREEGRGAMERLLRADPGAVADPDVYPPGFVERFESARAALGALPRRRVSISTGSPRARIFVEGRELGQSAATVELHPGRYTLGVVVGTSRLPPLAFEVGAADLAIPIETDIAESLRPRSGPGLAVRSEERDARLRSLARWLRSDELYAVSARGAGKERVLAVAVLDARTGAVRAEGTLRLAGSTPPPGGLAALAALLVSRESSPLVELGLLAASFFDRAPEPPVAGPTPQGGPGPQVLLPEGSFPSSATDGPATVGRFYLDVTEVTASAYAACVTAGGCSRPGGGARCTFGVAGKERHPVNCVDWTQAERYCRWAGRRLPSEVEWEWAARGADRAAPYPWGAGPPRAQACWSGLGSDRRSRRFEATCEVGSYPAGDSPQGVKDLAGNVAEWTTGVIEQYRVDRGGSWATVDPEQLTATHRGGREYQVGASSAARMVVEPLSPAARRGDLGFRCARSP